MFASMSTNKIYSGGVAGASQINLRPDRTDLVSRDFDSRLHVAYNLVTE